MARQDNLRCKAVVSGNVRNFHRAILGRESASALPLFVFPKRQSHGLQRDTKGGFLFSFDCRVVELQARHLATAPQVDVFTNRRGRKSSKMSNDTSSTSISASCEAPGSCTTTASQSNSQLTGKPEIQEYCENQLDVIRQICGDKRFQTPVSFVCIAAFIGYLSRLAYGNNRAHDNDSKMYKDFVEEVMGASKSDYKIIADELYYVFRCGIVHSMSFTPPVDASTPKCNIAISHDPQTKWESGSGFYKENRQGVEWTVLNADDLTADLSKAILHMFADAALRQHAIDFTNKQPPIKGI